MRQERKVRNFNFLRCAHVCVWSRVPRLLLDCVCWSGFFRIDLGTAVHVCVCVCVTVYACMLDIACVCAFVNMYVHPDKQVQYP